MLKQNYVNRILLLFLENDSYERILYFEKKNMKMKVQLIILFINVLF